MIEYNDIQKIIFSLPLDKNERFAKLTGRRIKIKDTEHIQFEGICNNKAYHENIPLDNLRVFFERTILKYKRADIFTEEAHYMAFNKNGDITFHKTKQRAQPQKTREHNRDKNHIINEGDNIPILCELGIFNKDFKIIKGMYSKFKQVNNFIEIIDSEFKDIKLPEVMRVVDFGCGNSYLTFVIYYYFTKIKKIRAHVTGIDKQADIIERCRELAVKYDYGGLYFECCDIKDYSPPLPPNMVVSLHGCDTATDYAIYKGIEWGSGFMFVAPCCQKEVNAQLRKNGLGSLYAPLRYGVLKDRFSSIITDGLRANILEIFDYKVDIAEFVGFNHSPKNLLIKAVKSAHRAEYKELLANQIKKLITDFGVDQTLYNYLRPGGGLQ